MARKPRLHIPAGFYHVMLRGNGGQDIFFDSEDRTRFYFLMQEGVERFGHRVRCFCLMTNHIHLLIQVGEISLSQIMQNLSFRYSRWVNRRYKRMGHLFQGRYKALLVDEDSYLIELVRYIHLNPVRAGLVRSLDDYEWSSHQSYLGVEAIPWLSQEWVLSQFSDSRGDTRNMYYQFILDGCDERWRKDFHRGAWDTRIIGDDIFMQKVSEKINENIAMRVSLDCLILKVCEVYQIEVVDMCGASRMRLLAEARGVAGWLVAEIGQHKLAELARRMNRDPSGLSLLVKKTRARATMDECFNLKINELKKELTTQ